MKKIMHPRQAPVASLLARVLRGGAFHAFFSILVMLGIPLAASAQYRVDRWGAENGLPQSFVRDLVQTRDGYLWMTTLGGLVRFDGLQMKVFTKATQPEIPSNRFTFLWEDRAGNLWIGTEEGGVLRYRDGVFTVLSSRDGLPGNYVDHLDEDEAGAILIFTDQGAAQWRDGKLTRLEIARPPDAAGSPVWRGGFSRYLKFALRSSASGDELFSRGRWEALPIPAGLSPGWAKRDESRSLKRDTRGRLWFQEGGVSGYYERRNGKWEMTLTPGLQGAPFYLDRLGRYWTTYKTGVALEKDGTITPLPVQGVTWAYKVLEDREGNFWLGTYDQGLFRVMEQAIRFLELPGRPNEQYVYPLLEDRRGVVWISAGEAGLTRYANGGFTRFPLQDASGVLDISSFHEDLDGSLLVGTYLFGMTRFRDGQWRKEPELSARIKGRVDVMVRDRQGNLWFGGLNGLDRRGADGQWTHYGPDNGLPVKHVKIILEDSAGRLWVGGYGCLAIWREGRFTVWTKNEGLTADRIISLHEGRDGVFWVGTADSGMYRFQPRGETWRLTQYTSRDGLRPQGIKQIFEDDRGYLWVGAEQGIYRLNIRELNEFAEGRSAFITSVWFGKADGLKSVECIGGFQPSGFQARDGRFWVPTQEGVAILDPRRVTVNTIPPPVSVEEVLLDRRPVDWRQGVRINPGQSSLEIRYTGLSFDRAEQVRFRYRLEGLEEEWVEAGTRRTAYFSHIPPGTYDFRVIAANSDGVWNSAGRTLRIVVLPPFYRTWWFLTLLTGAGIALVGLAFYARLRQLNERNARQEAFSRALIDSQEAERKRIAAELHDGLGQNLIIIKNWATLGLTFTEPEAPVREQLQEISTAAVQSLKEVREIISNLRPHQLETVGLTRTLTFMCEHMASAAGLTLQMEIAPLDGRFAPEDEVIFFRLVQEGLNNIVKHAQARKATIRVERRADGLHLSIEDDGRGFDPATQTGPRGQTGRLRGGFGLNGLAERARQLGGTFQIQSAPGRGAKINIVIPRMPDDNDSHNRSAR